MKTKKKPKKWGGPRKGAGRPVGTTGTGKGRTVITGSISMPPEKWETLDDLRGEMSRGKFIGGLLP